MRRVLLTAAALAVVLSLGPRVASAGPTTWDGRDDIGALMDAASARWDIGRCDAVVLLDEESVEILSGGGRRTTVHTVVWFATDLVTELYSDVRVPWDSATSRLEVHALRTWRDGRWWPHAEDLSPTAIVETLPGALSRADDYTTVRETVLLHDGVELPCIVETAYTVTEDTPVRPGVPEGADGLRVFAREDPVVLGRLTVSAPGDGPLVEAHGNGAPAPSESVGSDGRKALVWEVDLVDRLPRPLADDPASTAPYAHWSTWESWDALASRISGALSAAGDAPPALCDTLAKRVEHDPVPYSRVKTASDLVSESVTAVHYDDALWRLTPRPVSRTWETAYGHRLDRAALAAVAFREVGATTLPLFRSRGCGAVDDVPGLSRFDGMRLLVEAGGVTAVYDPVEGTLAPGIEELAGRAVWSLEDHGGPTVVSPAGGAPATLDVTLVLKPGEEGAWSGTGRLSATEWLSPYPELVGLGSEASDGLGALASSILEGAEVTGHGFTVLSPDRVEAGFAFELAAIEPDESSRTRISVGRPATGLSDRLGAVAHLYDDSRSSAVVLPGPARETVTLVVEVGEREVVRMPEDSATENAAGSLAVTVELEDGRLAVTRTLTLASGTVPPAEWKALRSLLLEHASERTSAVLFAE